jgi:eukaryotic-like serine/threonine-protein kinase
MAGEFDPRHLLEVILDTGKSPEEVCQGDPELLAEVRARLQYVRLLQAQLDIMLPASSDRDAGTTAPRPWTAQPPHLSGFDVQGELGRGGIGVVYRAWDQSLHRPVALKMLLAGDFARPDERERFLREAEAAAGLRHANIVQVYQVGDLEGRPYFTMEFVEGGSLADRLGGAPLAGGRATMLLATLAEAVQAAHDRGIVHRDLKPGNVLLTEDGTPKIADFGLARRLDDGAGLSRSGIPLGTPNYMAPEQALGLTHSIGPAADVYALGAILYEALTGRPPSRADTTPETLRQVVEQEPTPPSRWNATVPRDLEVICLKCLRKEPHRRYPSAAALAADLRRFERGEPITARSTGPLKRSVRWLGRRRVQVAALAVGTLLGVALVGGGLPTGPRGRRGTPVRRGPRCVTATGRRPPRRAALSGSLRRRSGRVRSRRHRRRDQRSGAGRLAPTGPRVASGRGRPLDHRARRRSARGSVTGCSKVGASVGRSPTGWAAGPRRTGSVTAGRAPGMSRTLGRDRYPDAAC